MTNDEGGFSAGEREAIKRRAAELAAGKGIKGAAKKAKEMQACLDAIAGFEGDDRRMAERFHVVVSEEAPNLDPKTFYGAPAYAKNGKVMAFIQPASLFKARYATIGFQEDAQLDDGDIWPTSYAVVAWTEQVEAQLRQVVRRAGGAD